MGCNPGLNRLIGGVSFELFSMSEMADRKDRFFSARVIFFHVANGAYVWSNSETLNSLNIL